MALKQNINKSFPAFVLANNKNVYIGNQDIIGDAYIKIESTEGTKDKISFIVVFLLDNPKLRFEEKHYFTPNLEGDNFIKQAYLYLKSLPEYADAVDC